MTGVFARLVRTMGLAVPLFACATGLGEASPAAGVVIMNTVTAQYSDPRGLTYGVQSNTVSVSIAAVSAVAVSPKETAIDPVTEGFPAGTPIVRTFTITNAGNVADAFTVQSLTTGAGTVTSVAFLTASGTLPVTLGTTVSPSLQPGESVKVQAVIATSGAAVGAVFGIALTARSTNAAVANGLVTDSAKEWAVAQPGASIAGPSGPATSVNKLVNEKRTHPANPGEVVTYSIVFKNYGGSPATNVIVTDDVPPGIVPLPRTVALNGVNAAASATLAGQKLTVHVGTLAVGAVDTLTFDATVRSGSTAGTSYVNVASLSADGIAPVTTTPASVLVGLGNVVYDGYAGGSSPVNGAVMTLRDFGTKAVVALPQLGSSQDAAARMPQDVLIGVPPGGLAPNTANRNPFTTGADGAYSFVFNATQLGTAAQSAQYELDIAAPGYRGRRIAVSISPDPSGLLYNATLKELDDQMLATPGGFTLTANAVSLSEVFGLLGNMPMFAPHPLAVSKTVDRDVASGGDRLVYTLQVGSQGTQFGATRVVDTLPSGVVYAPGTARVDGVPVEPQRNGRILTWTFAALDTQHTITYACVVMPYASDGATLINVVDVDAASGTGARLHAAASADTRVLAGALGNRIVITGRVFVDAAKTGRFREGDRGVAGVRIYLEDGSSVTTDQYGRFTFPSVHPGQHVLRVDTTTLPSGVRAYDDRRYDSPRSLQRLLHGLYDAGLMHDVNFAVEPAA
ncbi:MAG: hypothetical protein QOJ39_1806 [Candidatus Eremiobacteraeota bacterium]|jgi:uncharacterized repeat protein (TIGR01451 family)|nr:hypothetical protein [Candidatus Eremiobacteraeota bacterium]